MKDYTFLITGQKSRGFIESYDIDLKTNKIILHLSTGELYKIDYNSKKVKKIEERMKKQALEGQSVLDELKTKEFKEKAIKHISLIFSIILVVTGNEYYHLFIDSNSAVIAFISSILFTLGMALNSYLEEKVIKKRIDDIEKHALFIDIEKDLNEKIVNKDINIMINVPEKVQKKVTERNGLNFNGLEGLSLEDLKTLKTNLERCREIETIFDESKMDDEVKKLSFDQIKDTRN